jgi:hypothetical protein
MLRLAPASNMPSIGEDEVAAEADEPPDDYKLFKRLPTPHFQDHYDDVASPMYQNDRRESLLTRALMSSPDRSPEATEFPCFPRMLSSHPPTVSLHSNVSVSSTAELTSDGGMTSPERSNTPSPPPPSSNFHSTITTKAKTQPSHVAIADDSKPPTLISPTSNHESVVEANLGRKRCITFACGRKIADEKAAATKKAEEPKPVEPAEPPKRKCTLTFACPTRASKDADDKNKLAVKPTVRRQPSPAPFALRKPSTDLHPTLSRQSSLASDVAEKKDLDKSEKTRFHEFEISHEEEDEWVNESTEAKHKITVNDCMKKEMAIRKIGEEAEAEAREDEEEDDAVENANDDDDLDFSDDGNESDNEEGFAESDDESDAGSDYTFWAPSITTAATSTDRLEHIRINRERNASETSLDSIDKTSSMPIFQGPLVSSKKRAEKLRKFRPGTPDLPDSTDFVCGTLDEDRPLEVAYMSCLEERKRSKHIPIPQDIDPSFPTSDPEANDDDDDEDVVDDSGEPLWIKGNMEGLDDTTARGRRRKSTDHTIKSSSQSPRRFHSPPPRKSTTHRSPPPPTKRMRSPAPPLRLKSPAPIQRTSMAISPTRQAQPMRITSRHPGCELVRTKSLPRTPNPFFALQGLRKHDLDVAEASPMTTVSIRRPSVHTRGPIDIVEGLEKKRQKRREKFWRQHCRKVAKEQLERKPIPGKGAERMKELGLEVAERCKGYGLGQPAELVLSI